MSGNCLEETAAHGGPMLEQGRNIKKEQQKQVLYTNHSFYSSTTLTAQI